jgi:hypothetical protein
MNNLVAWRQHEFEHVVHNAINIAVGNFRVIAFAGQDATVLQAFDVLACNANVHGVKFHAGIAFADFYCIADSADGFFNIGDNAAQYACTFNFAYIPMISSFPCVFLRPARQHTFVVPMSSATTTSWGCGIKSDIMNLFKW